MAAKATSTSPVVKQTSLIPTACYTPHYNIYKTNQMKHITYYNDEDIQKTYSHFPPALDVKRYISWINKSTPK